MCVPVKKRVDKQKSLHKKSSKNRKIFRQKKQYFGKKQFQGKSNFGGKIFAKTQPAIEYKSQSKAQKGRKKNGTHLDAS